MQKWWDLHPPPETNLLLVKPYEMPSRINKSLESQQSFCFAGACWQHLPTMSSLPPTCPPDTSSCFLTECWGVKRVTGLPGNIIKANVPGLPDHTYLVEGMLCMRLLFVKFGLRPTCAAAEVQAAALFRVPAYGQMITNDGKILSASYLWYRW